VTQVRPRIVTVREGKGKANLAARSPKILIRSDLGYRQIYRSVV
jgi:hypothetical protein